MGKSPSGAVLTHLGPQGLPRAVHVMCGGSRPQPRSSRQTSVAAFLTKSVPSKVGTGVTLPTPLSPPDSFLVDTGSSCSLQAWGVGNSPLRFPTGTSRGIPSPTDCLPSELGLSQLLKSWHTDWKVSTKRLGFPSLSAVAPAKPQDAEMPSCASRPGWNRCWHRV
uniref:Uncharacterized protein n=1 Tax=Myotis myotis TaxID=51298 RepID=A0A7J7TJ75_MYOMY|nr:hypothetical protein mMyoMyo1_009049 [Myotis myotis]